jgi:hypothetical protein
MGDMVFDTPEGVAFFRLTAIASGAALYINSGLRPNRHWTPTRMRDALNGFTGSKAKNLKGALLAYVEMGDQRGYPVTNTQVLRAVGRGE